MKFGDESVLNKHCPETDAAESSAGWFNVDGTCSERARHGFRRPAGKSRNAKNKERSQSDNYIPEPKSGDD